MELRVLAPGPPRKSLMFNNLGCYLSLVDWHVCRGFQELGGGVMGGLEGEAVVSGGGSCNSSDN